MLRSMTGFGRCLLEHADVTQQWEVKSVNSRHLELRWRLPVAAHGLEPRLEKVTRRFVVRGRVDISLDLRSSSATTAPCCFNAGLARAMLESLHRLAAERGESFIPDYSALFSVSRLWSGADDEPDEGIVSHLEEGLTLALEDWNEARAVEGVALGADMLSRILRMEEWTGLIAERAPIIREERVDALRERLGEAFASSGRDLEEPRLLQEVVILADRLDVSEELTRLSTHLERLRELLQGGGDVGRRLDFTLQECFREINTCGSKLPDIQLSRLVVDFKNELEKCREQVQNLE
ncbi:MAG: YicC family protein [Desulfovibrio sp.]|nr:YicC family protein [Desulfovibrio sp.]